MTDADRAKEEENWARAEEIYETELLPKFLDTEKGNILVLDIESGDYEIDADLLTASDRLQVRRPGAFEYTFRIGYPAVVTLGRKYDVIEL